MNVVIDQTARDLGAASRGLSSAARLIAGREVLTAADLLSVQQKIASARADLDRVEAEINAPRTGLTIPRADWDDRNEIAATRAASNGASA